MSPVPKEDGARHVDHVCETAEDLGAVEILFRMWTGLKGVNPVMVCRRVVGIFLEDGLENLQAFFLARARLAVVVAAIPEGIRKKNARLQVLGIALDELPVRVGLSLSVPRYCLSCRIRSGLEYPLPDQRLARIPG